MSVVGLFAGIGGFELAFSEAGFRTQMLVEKDPAANAVLRARFPDADVRKDVNDMADLPGECSVVTAGFPCQNLSMAGDKSGLSGSQSGAVSRMFELIRRSTVPVVVIENVNFMLHLDSGNAMLWLVDQFESLGYRWAYRVLDTMGFGLPHRRRRVYMVATRDIDPRTVLFADEAVRPADPKPDLMKPLGFYWTEGRSGVGFTVDGIPPLKVGSALGIASAPAVLFPDGEVLMPSVAACERLQGFPPGWIGIVEVNGTRRSEWRMIGNAVSTPVARWVADRLKSPGEVQEFASVRLTHGSRWPNAAWNVGTGRMGVTAGDKPIQVDRPSVSTFRDSSWTRLSNKALDGFINRAAAGGLRMPEGFLDALRKAERAAPRRINS